MIRLGPTIVGKVRGTNALIIIIIIIIVIIIIIINILLSLLSFGSVHNVYKDWCNFKLIHRYFS